jgi:hypothetical protein
MHRFDGTSSGELLAPEKQECTATTSRPSRHPPRTHRYGANPGPGPSRCRLPFEYRAGGGGRIGSGSMSLGVNEDSRTSQRFAIVLFMRL